MNPTWTAIAPVLLAANVSAASPELEKATFAGGCFWCIEAPFEHLEGVHSVVSGYTGGDVANPTYEQVGTGRTGHVEAVQITFDPSKITYEKLLDVYWMQFDPTDAGGSFGDRGFQYTSAIFYHSADQKKKAETSKKTLDASKKFPKPVVTPIKPAKPFYPAEEYHQDFYKKNTLRYKSYRKGSGREDFIKKHWKDGKKIQGSANTNYHKPDDRVLRQTLTPLQYKVTQKEGTEPSFKNEYWDNKKPGIYVDIVSGEPLFSSTHKYKSGTGWPSFTQPLAPEHVVEKKDFKLLLPRTEVRSKYGGSHLGHVFSDGPEPTGLRYCINSASLRFIPVEDLEKEGYGEYAPLFAKQ